MKIIECQDYQISIGPIVDSLELFLLHYNYPSIAIIVDENTRKHCLPIIMQKIDVKKWIVIEISSGESHKNLQTCELIWNKLLINNFDRHSLVINLGGGVIGDMGGFCASTYMRGIDFIHIPTTLLSQVDSSVGGKLGIDVEMVKNIVGVFGNPKAVFVDLSFLKTLDENQMRSGMAELIKHGLIADATLWKDSSVLGINPKRMTEDLLYRSILVKKNVIEQDPKERGLRKILNFGHTIGHAVETVSYKTKTPLLHGEAILVGMICEVYLSFKKKLISEATKDEVNKALKKIYYNQSACENITEILKLLQKDKKNRQNQVLAALLNDIGSAVFDISITNEEVMESFHYYQNI